MAEHSFNLLDTDFCDCFDLFSKNFEFKEHKENVQENEDCKNVTQTESESASSGSVGRFPQIKEEKLCFYETRGPRGPWVAHLRKRSKVTVEPIIENPRGIIRFEQL